MPKSMKRSTITNNVWYKNMLVGNDAFSPGAYELISTQVLASAAASVTFSSIPQTYKHLQLRFSVHTTTASADNFGMNLTLNASSTGYARHVLYGDGSSVGSFGATSESNIQLYRVVSGGTLDGGARFGAGVVDVLDYASSSKNTTIRSLHGATNLASNFVNLQSGLWVNTSAVTSTTLTSASGDFTANSRFSIYGIKGE
jgi:hypothetical protein